MPAQPGHLAVEPPRRIDLDLQVRQRRHRQVDDRVEYRAFEMVEEVKTA